MTTEEEEAAGLLADMLKPLSPAKDRPDQWVWLNSGSTQFTVKFAYSKLISSSDTSALQEHERVILKKFWMTVAPSKYLVHGWRLLLDKLPTRCLLQQRGIINFQPSPYCIFCFRHNEDSEHLFFGCNISE